MRKSHVGNVCLLGICKFNVIHFRCNYIKYVNFNTNLLHNSFYMLINVAT